MVGHPSREWQEMCLESEQRPFTDSLVAVVEDCRNFILRPAESHRKVVDREGTPGVRYVPPKRSRDSGMQGDLEQARVR